MLSKAEILNQVYPAGILNSGAIYFLIKNNEIVYVGQSKNLGMRLDSHIKSKDFDSFFFIMVDESELNATEYAYVMKFSPALNMDNPPKPFGYRNGGMRERVYDYIVSYQGENGKTPTLKEIAAAIGISPVTAKYHIDKDKRLVRRGRRWIEVINVE